MPTNLLIPLGAILAACITGAVTFVTLVISKEQKISEFRQAWVDSLREELSAFAGHARRIAHEQTYVSLKGMAIKTVQDLIDAQEEDSKRPDVYHSNRQEMAHSYYALRLRLNPEENDHLKLLNCLDEIYKVLNISSDVTRREDCIQELDELARVAQGVLKREWTRVKEGEPRFKFVTTLAKWVALIAVTVAIGIIAMFLFR